MSELISKVTSKGRQLSRRLGAKLARVSPFRPIFVIGCGRSGTTILGQALALHPAVTYLNEPRHLWTDGYPETDIWSLDAESRGGRLVLGQEHTRPEVSRHLRHIFGYEIRRTGRPQLIEKLPINSFRLPFILEVFPDARFVLLSRHPAEVARSIAKAAADGPWFGHCDYKWRQLCELAWQNQETEELPDLCEGAYLRGLLEWRLSNQAAEKVFGSLPPTRVARITYRQLVAHPSEALNKLLTQLGLEPSPAVEAFGRDQIARRTTTPTSPPTDRERQIVGPLLDQWSSEEEGSK